MGHQSSSGKMRDYCDGVQFKTHPLFATCPNALQIILYYDDLEVCNALGTKSKIHKLSKSLRIISTMYTCAYNSSCSDVPENHGACTCMLLISIRFFRYI